LRLRGGKARLNTTKFYAEIGASEVFRQDGKIVGVQVSISCAHTNSLTSGWPRPEYLCQDSYIDKVANRYHLTNWKAPTTTPLSTEELVPYELKATLQEIHAYQSKVGSLQFTATVTRPDTAYAASKLAEFLTNPGPQQIAAVGQALTYLYATRYLAIAYAPPEPESTSAGQGDF
jgi:hypothetical protein